MNRRQFLSGCVAGSTAVGGAAVLGFGWLFGNKGGEAQIPLRIKNWTLDSIPIRITITENELLPYFEERVFQKTYEIPPRWSPLTEERDSIINEEDAFRAENGDKFTILVDIIDGRQDSFNFTVSCTDYQYEENTVLLYHETDADSRHEYRVDFNQNCPGTPL